MKLRYSRRAVRDLAEIGHYLKKRSLAGARAVESKIKATIGILATFPESGRILAERPHVRVMPVVRYPYLVFYKGLAGRTCDPAHQARCSEAGHVGRALGRISAVRKMG